MKKLMMAVMVAGMAAAALADVSFSYSGQLRNETGGAVSEKTPTITFSLYSDAAGGKALWARMIPVQLDDNGYFAVELSNANGSTVGTETKLEEVLANNATLYIGLNVQGSSGEISPRQKLISTPRAAFAEDVKTAKQGFTVNGAAVFMNGLTVGSGASATVEIKTNGTINAKSIKQDGNVLIPSGVIVMWSGLESEIPSGWALCDGQEGRPDLRGRFVVGAGAAGSTPTDRSIYKADGTVRTGGAEKVEITADLLPPHNHQYWLSKQRIEEWRKSSPACVDGVGTDHNSDSRTVAQLWPDACTKTEKANYYFGSDYSGSTSPCDIYLVNTTTAGSKGADSKFDNRPPYYALCYIIKL